MSGAPRTSDAHGKALSVVVAGGGTAGHIEPAMAVADALRRLDPSIRVTARGPPPGRAPTRVAPRGDPRALL
ncbi:glycosyltransferase, partial [Nocardia cyriacigeorgica]|uniref:glycosyltransferase n=1 Tax=Nocardia cyriacigeorgica TaxID=135487 RepID=UPI002454B920